MNQSEYDELLVMVTDTQRKVTELHEVILQLLSGLENAKNSGGFQGMMAQQMFKGVNLPSGV